MFLLLVATCALAEETKRNDRVRIRRLDEPALGYEPIYYRSYIPRYLKYPQVRYITYPEIPYLASEPYYEPAAKGYVYPVAYKSRYVLPDETPKEKKEE